MKPVTFQDILYRDKSGKWYNQNRELTQKEIESLQSEAKYFENSRLWALLVNEGKLRMQTRMAVEANTGNDIRDLVILRKAQEYLQAVQMFEEVIRKLNSTRE